MIRDLSGRRRVVAITTCGVLVVALAVSLPLALTAGGGVKRHGPINGGDPTAEGAQMTAGQPMFWGMTTLENADSKPATIDNITIASHTPGFVRRIRVDTPQANIIIGAGRGFPPPLKPGERLPMRMPKGAQIIHGHDLHVLVELVPPRNGKFSAGPITITYHIGDQRYRQLVPSYATACAPRHRSCVPIDPKEVN